MLLENAKTNTMSPQKPATMWTLSFVILFFSSMAFNLGLSISNSLLPLYTNSLGATAATIGLVGGSFTISAILFRFISAPIMDTYNRKHLVIIAALLLAIAFWGFSISDSIVMLIGFRMVQGCGMAFGNACCLAMVAEMIPKEKYNSGIGYFSLTQVISQAIGPNIGLELIKRTEFSLSFTIVACLLLFAAFLAGLIKSKAKQAKKLILTFHSVLAMEALTPACIQFFIQIGNATINSFLILFSREQNVMGNIGLYFTVTAVTMLFTRPLIGNLTDKYGIAKIVFPALIVNLLSFVIISNSTTLASFLTAAVFNAFGQGAIIPVMQALAMKSVTNDRRGVASSTVFVATDLGFLIGNVLIGQVVQSFGYVFMWRTLALPSIACMLILLLFRSKIKRIEKEFASR